MRVFELAKELGTTSAVVLEKLKTLKLKAKDKDQELNTAVLMVVRSGLKKDLKDKPRVQEEPVRPVKPSGRERPWEKFLSKEPKEVLKEKEIKKVKKEPEEKPKAKPAKVLKEKVTEAPEKKAPAKPPVVKEAVQKPVAVVPAVPVEPPKPVFSKAPASAEPFVSVKPLPKRRKRTSGSEVREDASGQSFAASTGGLQPLGGPPGSVMMPFTPGVPVEGAKPLRPLELNVPISIKDFASAIQEKTNVVLKKLLQMGILANINQAMGEDVLKRLSEDFGYIVTKVKTQEEQIITDNRIEEENPEFLTSRPPVVTFMGHVDHGKTSLLDRIRKSQVADKEHGGITQHIGAYSVQLPKGKITFLDTPGHEAFTSMRARGAHITDLVILVVAADEGVMPQTEEAINHARAANVPILVALNKIDRRGADIDKVKKQLADRNLSPEDWGGKTIVAPVSAITGEGIENLLEMIILEAEMLELRANEKKHASGIVVEAHLSRGRGAVATLIVQSGTLRLNDIVIVGPYYGKVKAMFDDWDRPATEAGPSSPVGILGLSAVPEAGEKFYVVGDEKKAKEIASQREEKLKKEKLMANKRITLEDLYAQIKQGNIKELNVILKADVQGSLEALKDSLEKIPSEEVKVKLIHTGVGDINASDVILAFASNAIIIGFHVDIGVKAKEELEKQEVDVRLYRIIYDAVNDMRKALEGLLEPRKRRKILARVEVRQVFKLSSSGIVAGCQVIKGKVTRKSNIDVIRGSEVVHSGTISSLKRFKDDVREVLEGFECGITLNNFTDVQPGDILEAYEVETIARTLGAAAPMPTPAP